MSDKLNIANEIAEFDRKNRRFYYELTDNKLDLMAEITTKKELDDYVKDISRSCEIVDYNKA